MIVSTPAPPSDLPDWLPPLLRLNDHGGDAKAYLEALYAVFRRDFVESQPRFQGKWVRCRRDPLDEGKEAGFWHCISEGKTEAKRMRDKSKEVLRAMRKRVFAQVREQARM